MDFPSQILGTVLLRPYVLVFLLAYIAACSLHLGLKRALLFAAAGYAVAWLSEYSSIHTGIPYGHYYYIETTRDRELWVLGVPFMDSISFVFLSYASYSMALLVRSPLFTGQGVYLLETRQIRDSFRTRLMGALFFVYLDIVIDPVALRGSRWFLGQIYGYPGGGIYFGVPISNFIGWFVVGFALIYLLQKIDRFLDRSKVTDKTGWSYSWRYMPGPALYLSVLIFNLAVTFFIGEYNIGWAGIFIVVLPLALVISFLLSRRSWEIRGAVEAHVRDFPRAVLPSSYENQRSGKTIMP
jgi:putative membrane protein